MRSYDQYCSLARALDIIGDRWTQLADDEQGPAVADDVQSPGQGAVLVVRTHLGNLSTLKITVNSIDIYKQDTLKKQVCATVR